MKSQEKLLQLINDVYDYNTTIKKTVLSDMSLSDNQAFGYFDVKNKCLHALYDIILLTESSKITSAAAETLSKLLFGMSSANQLDRNTLQKAVGVCDTLKKNIIVNDVVYKAKEEKAALFQGELLPLKKLFGLSDTFILEKSTSKIFFDDSIYETMNLEHIQLIIDEISRIQQYFLRGSGSKNYIPVWFLRFVYNFGDFVARKQKQAKIKNFSIASPGLSTESLEKKRHIPVNFDLSYRHLENFMSCESYVSARDLCQDMITAFPDDKRIPELKEKLKKIQKHIEDMKNMRSSQITTKKISISVKKVDPDLIDPTTGRIKDGFL